MKQEIATAERYIVKQQIAKKICVYKGGEELSKPQTCTELTLARKNAPLPAVLERAFPKWSSLETSSSIPEQK